MRHTDTAPIIVGVDGSQSSIEALRAGARLAEAFDTPLEAITTWDFRALSGGYFPIQGWSPREDARTVLAEAIDAAFDGSAPSRLTATVREGAPASVLIEASTSAAMLVVGSRGHGGFMGLLLGSVSAACAEHAQCPVLVMHGRRVAGEDGEDEQIAESAPILVGVDGSDSSIEALRAGARLATAFEAPLEAITTWDLRALPGEYYPFQGWSPSDDARAVLAVALERAFGGDAPSSLTSHVLQGSAARTLVEESKRGSMLVLGSRGHGGFMGLLLGSVSAACAEYAHCPVLVVHTRRADAASEAVAS